MFEYLMPELFMRSRPGTLLNESARAVVRLQRQLGEARQRPWGVSESGYHAFDMHLNYQYRAFGLREVALGGGARQSVVAPYASLLALCICPGKVADNVLAMREAGWAGAYGFFEAADYTGAHSGEGPKLVRSYMAHHQGMALAALANALAGDAISRCFESIPEARALSLLLEEKPFRPRETASQARGARARKRAPRRGSRPARGALREPPRRRASALRRGGHGAVYRPRLRALCPRGRAGQPLLWRPARPARRHPSHRPHRARRGSRAFAGPRPLRGRRRAVRKRPRRRGHLPQRLPLA